MDGMVVGRWKLDVERIWNSEGSMMPNVEGFFQPN